ncbi:MAG: 1-deoxy-D-xylulose 5-phosphate reductoisomerase [Candidatus Anoxychlamydiales bacterium]|nr:1-deoxy-D-xylulose 5-phosphate reductoisomerase [Candidatus Anoxychlamydiales bacterium]NGX35399.1 1-deoxy-D-xylulose 5-phosphate reductoisomerase [Candidatus Anoxychlamydiales bacterium]
MKKIAILGSTGSIGKTTLDVIRESKDLYEVVALAAFSNIDELEKQASEFNPKIIAVFDEKKAKELKKRLSNIKIVLSIEGLIEVATREDVDFVMMAISGSIALQPTIEAIKANKTIGLANKEVLVAAGSLIKDLKKKHECTIIPVDSEHSAIFQCLKNEDQKSIKRLIITSSGGPFFKYRREELKNIGLKEALKHPNFAMGKKITIDSSTMMNKGLEIIEAYHLFEVKQENIDVVIHPEQIIHSMVEFIDGSILAQLSEPTMEIPIRYAISYPNRIKSNIKNFDFTKNSTLSFFEPDLEKFLCLKLAMDALKVQKSLPCFMNKANEILVKRFLEEKITWIDISIKLEKLMSLHKSENLIDLSSILEVEEEAIKKAEKI